MSVTSAARIKEYGNKRWKTFINEIEYKINTASEREQIELVKYRDYYIKYIINPSKELQLETVKQNGLAIQYIYNPSKEIQLEAVKENGYAIEYIDDPSEEVQLEAVKEVIRAIQYIKNPTEKVLQYVLEQDSFEMLYLLRYIENDLKEGKKDEF